MGRKRVSFRGICERAGTSDRIAQRLTVSAAVRLTSETALRHSNEKANYATPRPWMNQVVRSEFSSYDGAVWTAAWLQIHREVLGTVSKKPCFVFMLLDTAFQRNAIIRFVLRGCTQATCFL